MEGTVETFWTKQTGELIVDASGAAILCTHCPCNGKVIVPAGTVITYTMTRTMTRRKDYEVRETSNGQIGMCNRNHFEWTWTHKVEGSYTTTADIEVGGGVWIDLLDSTRGTATTTLEGDGSGLREEYNPMTNSWDSRTYTAEMQQPQPGQPQPIPFSARGFLQLVDEGGEMVLKWTQYEGSHTTTRATDYSSLKWTPVPSNYQIAWLLAPSEESYTETVTGGTGQKGYYQQTLQVSSMDHETGQASADLAADASCDFTESWGESIGTQKGTDKATDKWTASWTMALPKCSGCGGL